LKERNSTTWPTILGGEILSAIRLEEAKGKKVLTSELIEG